MSIVIPPGIDLSQIPFGFSPDGTPPNFTDSAPSLATAAIVSGTVFAVLATLAVSTRMFVASRSKFHLDDAFSLMALAMTHGYMGIVCGNHLPVSLRHSWDVPLSIVDASYIKSMAAAGFIAGPAIWSARATILLVQLRVFKPKRWFRITTYIILTLLTLVHWSNVPVFIALCVPHNSSEGWDFLLLQRCFPSSLHSALTGTLGAGFDVIMLILPQPLIYQLHLSIAKKISLALTFAVGFLATIASVISIYYRFQLYFQQDITWNTGNVYICVNVETYTIIIVGCTPALATFWKTKISPSKFYQSLTSTIGTHQMTSRGTAMSKSDMNSTLRHEKQQENFGRDANYNHNGIQKTIQFSVSNEDRASDEIELTGVRDVRSKVHHQMF